MVNIAFRNNPYVQSANLHDAGIFIGRNAFFDRLQNDLDESDEKSSKPIVLYGPAQIGKTAVINQIENGRFGSSYLPISIDLNEVTLDSDSSFYWNLAHHVKMQVGNTTSVNIPKFNQTTFIAAPLQAFYLQLIKPLATSLEGKRLLFIFDNLNALTDQIHAEKLSPDLIIDLHNQLRQANNAVSIFAISLPDTTYNSIENLPFSQWINKIPIDPLTEEEVATLIREPLGYNVVHDVTHFIYEITRGHPGKTQQLCYELFEYQQANELSHITVADIISLQKNMIEREDEKTAVSSQTPTFTIQTNPNLDTTINTRNHQASWYKQPLFIIPIAILLLGLTTFLIQFSIRQQNNAAEIAIEITSTPLHSPDQNSSQNDIETAPSVIDSQTETPSPTPTKSEPSATSTPTSTSTLTPTSSPTIPPDSMPRRIIREQDGMEMVLVPADTFIMGSDEENVVSAPDEQPQREVQLNAFYIDIYEVNVEQYAAFLNRLGNYQRACDNVDCTLPRNLAGYTNYLEEQDLGDGTIQYFPMTGFANYPANHISWYGAKNYCQSVGARLPTEAEWEYAARGTDGRLYPWGDKAPDETLAVFQSETFDNMKPVDALPDGTSPFGLFGMAGSLWEWTSDWYDETYYLEAPNINPQGPETGFARVVRGGAWPFNNQADRIRTSNRYSLSPDFISSTVGFRCVRDP